MIIKTAEFVISNTDPEQCPITDQPEFAFVGRSNVGKSSLINMLTGFGDLAKVSTAPGKTRLINHFNINDQWFWSTCPVMVMQKLAALHANNGCRLSENT